MDPKQRKSSNQKQKKHRGRTTIKTNSKGNESHGIHEPIRNP